MGLAGDEDGGGGARFQIGGLLLPLEPSFYCNGTDVEASWRSTLLCTARNLKGGGVGIQVSLQGLEGSLGRAGVVGAEGFPASVRRLRTRTRLPPRLCALKLLFFVVVVGGELNPRSGSNLLEGAQVPGLKLCRLF